MKRLVVICAAALIGATAAFAEEATMTMLAPGDLQWQDAPPALPRGAKSQTAEIGLASPTRFEPSS